MAETTGISWTDATANFWMGCTKVSEACKFCYADRDMTRYGKDFNTLTRAKGIWADILNPKKFLPGSKVFTCSWSDFFHEGADAWRPEAWACIRLRPDLTFQILTKRPERIKDQLPPDWGKGWPNVWMGVTAENQQRADERIPLLLKVPAAIRFVSCEPLLGPLDLTSICVEGDREHGAFINALSLEEWGGGRGQEEFGDDLLPPLNWVITGGESGPNARPSHPDWFRSLRDQCRAAGVAFHFKQFGEFAPMNQAPDGTKQQGGALGQINMDHPNPLGTWVTRIGVKAAGRLLDGVLWDEMPDTTQAK